MPFRPCRPLGLKDTPRLVRTGEGRCLLRWYDVSFQQSLSKNWSASGDSTPTYAINCLRIQSGLLWNTESSVVPTPTPFRFDNLALSCSEVGGVRLGVNMKIRVKSNLSLFWAVLTAWNKYMIRVDIYYQHYLLTIPTRLFLSAIASSLFTGILLY